MVKRRMVVIKRDTGESAAFGDSVRCKGPALGEERIDEWSSVFISAESFL